MQKSAIALTVASLLLTTLVAGASAPTPGSFSTTGYTTSAEIGFLDSGYAKLRIQARGGPAYDDDALCAAAYGAPCADLCLSLGEECGVHGSLEGSFAFEEWGLFNPVTGAVINDGLLDITTTSGTTGIRFGGATGATTVAGSFSFLSGGGDYRRQAGGGAFAGNAGYYFKVDYGPCGGVDSPVCPVGLCAVRGADLKLKNSRATWRLANDGADPIQLENLLLHWPAENGALTSVRLGGKTLAEGQWSAPSVRLDLTDATVSDRELGADKHGVLTLQFENRDISQQAADYTFLAEFSGGCTAIHVAFP